VESRTSGIFTFNETKKARVRKSREGGTVAKLIARKGEKVQHGRGEKNNRKGEQGEAKSGVGKKETFNTGLTT